ncbi:MAG: hypothetical protein IPM96_15955 [Ignavibacteria bacterium]|nr:hypothetical protein [Ignavibacteria bacterium]
MNNFVPMFELNGEIFYKVFECGKIPSYMDPSKKYNENYIAEVAKNYDPVNVHEAPFWIGHPEYFTEPRSGGWIKRVLAVGKELYVTFSEVYPWMKELFNSGEFKNVLWRWAIWRLIPKVRQYHISGLSEQLIFLRSKVCRL